MSIPPRKTITRVILFGLTGFGNSALQALIRNPEIEIVGVITNNRPADKFPYYYCPPLHDVVEHYKIPLYAGIRISDSSSYDIINSIAPDLIIVSTYYQLIPQTIIDLPKYGVINFHPSLLPKYRGATPTYQVLANGETKTGVTAHFIDSEQFDKGRIVLQKKLQIFPEDTDGVLRERLSDMVGLMMSEVIDLVLTRNKESFSLQVESDSSFYPKRTEADGVINLSWPFDKIRNRIRAMTPYPGARIQLDGKLIKVLSVKQIPDNNGSTALGRVVETVAAGRILFIV